MKKSFSIGNLLCFVKVALLKKTKTVIQKIDRFCIGFPSKINPKIRQKTRKCKKYRKNDKTQSLVTQFSAKTAIWVDFGVLEGTKNEAKHALQKQMKKTCKEKQPKHEKSGSGGGVRRNARGGGEDPRRGIRTDQGQNPGKSFGQEMRAGQELEELERASSTPQPGGAADRYAHSAVPNQDDSMV